MSLFAPVIYIFWVVQIEYPRHQNFYYALTLEQHFFLFQINRYCSGILPCPNNFSMYLCVSWVFMTFSSSLPLLDIFFPSDKKICLSKLFKESQLFSLKRFCTCLTHSFFMIPKSPYGLLFLTSLKDNVSPSSTYDTYLKLFLSSDLLKIVTALAVFMGPGNFVWLIWQLQLFFHSL